MVKHNVEGGTIHELNEPTINRPFLAISKHEDKECRFYSKSGAEYWLWAISKRYSEQTVLSIV